MSISSSKGLTPDNRVRMIDNFLNQNKEEIKKSVSYKISETNSLGNKMNTNINKKIEDEDSGDE
jgi:hypothetical protein